MRGGGGEFESPLRHDVPLVKGPGSLRRRRGQVRLAIPVTQAV